MILAVFLVVTFNFLSGIRCSTPIVLWHGMGDSCCSSGSLGVIISLLKETIPNATVYSLRFGNNIIEEIENGYFLNANRQVELACEQISKNPLLADGYNAVGFSQGAQFLRAVAQRCPDPSMKTLVSLGGQHQGVYGLPKCIQPNTKWCDLMRRILNHGAYLNWVQNNLVQAQYWHDPLNEEEYREYSLFLADINNEKPVKNSSYADNLKKLEKLVLVMFENDTMVIPRETSWFGFYAPGQSSVILPCNDTHLYLNDDIGLQDLDRRGRIDFLSVNGNHLHFTKEWFAEEIIKKYLM